MKKFFQNIILLACIEKNIGDDLFVYVICKRYKNCNFIINNDAKYGDLIKLENLSLVD